ncbi:3-methyl-2-oxobutanoate dehydrogenase subunit VorB [Breznakiella homolactica]|uniref:3-methyl-2-oxobutanoate dehydrogenase subunit VorB n=1 Tax=Breznakiella homolactica TaxID=2798577 RepID=A0A7T8BB53_9SPIR|nr:3-methyl-2-oxobutanoate dehydrogenase subunit VorB [Breznakiella homolactica]QQO10202.1 3-methyl-2-oxobutanoate dehydrogenase subunit VorB [Breznakiella homolactica]
MNSEKRLMKGNDAIAEAAIRAGCTAYFGYPITPQNEIIAYMARHMIDKGRVFIQAESEVAAINMVYGASCAGARAMTSSSSPGVSLKQEGMSYAAGADIPLVLVNVVRGGPGLGSIAPAQSDYFQSTRGGGHGDYRCIVLAPKSVQECADLTYLAFDLADQYRMPAIVLADGMIGQMMEGVTLPPERKLSELPKRDWSVGGMAATHREAIHITSLDLVPAQLEEKTRARFRRYDELKAKETRFEFAGEDADLYMVAYGTSARVALGAKQLAEKEGIKLGLFRPITLFPFPDRELAKIAEKGKPILTVEMSLGQLVEDVKLAVLGKAPVHLLGHSGGVIPTEEEVFAEAKRILGRN